MNVSYNLPSESLNSVRVPWLKTVEKMPRSETSELESIHDSNFAYIKASMSRTQEGRRN